MFTAEHKAAANYRQDLGDGLVIRWSTAADAEHIAQLVSVVFRDKEEDPPNLHLYTVTKMLMSGHSPVMGVGDYAIVEDLHKEGNPIVAGICLQRLTWEYDGIAIPVGRPEIVATDPAYRNRGLIRKLFEVIHARSAAEGRLVEGITGIAYFYRQFDYEYALDLQTLHRIYLASIPKAKEGEAEAYTLREAIIEDLPRIKALYDQQRASYLVSTPLDDTYLRWLIEGWKSNPGLDRLEISYVILDAENTVQGYLLLPTKLGSSNLGIWVMFTSNHINIQAMMPSVLRALQTYGEQLPLTKPDVKPLDAIMINFPQKHPVYEALGNLISYSEHPYGWYVRITDLPRFIQHIAPALERRLINSAVAGYTGELKLDFYRSGLRLVFDKGHLTTAENWRSTVLNNNSDGGFPPLVFLKALFGYRSLADLRHAYPDVWVNNDVLFNALFPAKASWTFPL
jgi:GNAT superfamily N-acetyltransferase